ncbi:hypothetical protein VTK73DRAFT_7299 [Phialemonium thermophilum]|uniref:Replication protein A subunit n=1 Tax=Phialemonium thermophilum TaxID=223376 RepID=A0ABR3WFE8_9PEZI
MAAQQITQGALDAIFNDPQNVNTRFPVPVLQCLQVKTLEAKTATAAPVERYRVVLSDIRNFVQCMLATQANHVVHSGQLQRGCIVRLKQYQANEIKGKNIIIILDLEVIESLGTPDKIGDPVSVEVKAPATDTGISGTNFYGAKAETQEDSKSQVQKQLASRAPNGGAGGGSTDGGVTIYPIEALSPYTHGWTIKARVTNKSEVRNYRKGNGKLFNVNLLDESGEIRATGFNEQCDQFYDLLQEGSVYYISTPCRVTMAKKQFSNLPNDYELVFERDTVIRKAEDQGAVPQVRFNFCSIQELQAVEKDATVDVIGVLKDVDEVTSITSKTTNRPYDKRDITLVDDTGYSVRATLWGKTATNFDVKPESIVAFKGMRVSDFGGRSLSLLASGTMAVDPDIPEAHRLKGWYDASGRNDTFATHSSLAAVAGATGRQDQIKTIGEVKEKNLGIDDVEYFTLKATIVYIKQDTFAYPACRNEGCNKKVVDMGDGTWRCEKCDVAHARPEWRYIMTLSVADHTGQLYLSCFDEAARVVMGGRSADELMDMREDAAGDGSGEARLLAAFEGANCRKLSFRVRAKMDTYGEVQRVRYQVMSVSPIDYKSEAHRLVELIKGMSV